MENLASLLGEMSPIENPAHKSAASGAQKPSGSAGNMSVSFGNAKPATSATSSADVTSIRAVLGDRKVGGAGWRGRGWRRPQAALTQIARGSTPMLLAPP
jgi:hypothetical protein